MKITPTGLIKHKQTMEIELIEEGYFDDIFRQLGEVLADENMLTL